MLLVWGSLTFERSEGNPQHKSTPAVSVGKLLEVACRGPQGGCVGAPENHLGGVQDIRRAMKPQTRCPPVPAWWVAGGLRRSGGIYEHLCLGGSRPSSQLPSSFLDVPAPSVPLPQNWTAPDMSPSGRKVTGLGQEQETS